MKNVGWSRELTAGSRRIQKFALRSWSPSQIKILNIEQLNLEPEPRT